ncbi:helix-turn-helix transcriptional regulator [Paracoccus yeei]|uniref:helix-turn-helix transcriptional regulator n=1 Tax=Paracoccus yeei TaxID=147645 RepID=UPI0028D605ED|nr:helix-turn-helix domain-containing protein [Paracoccus yeei]
MSKELEPILLRDVQVAKLLGVHRNTIWNRVRQSRFPKPIKWEGLTVWRRRDIEEFVERLAD